MRLDRLLLCCSLSVLACASASESRVKPGDACRVYLQGRDGSVTLELANKAAAAYSEVEARSRMGRTKIAGDAEIEDLVAQLEEAGFFKNSIQGTPAAGRPCLAAQIGGAYWTLLPGAVGAETAETYGQSLSALQSAFNDTFAPQTRADAGRDLFEEEKRRLEAANQEAARRRGGKQ